MMEEITELPISLSHKIRLVKIFIILLHNMLIKLSEIEKAELLDYRVISDNFFLCINLKQIIKEYNKKDYKTKEILDDLKIKYIKLLFKYNLDTPPKIITENTYFTGDIFGCYWEWVLIEEKIEVFAQKQLFLNLLIVKYSKILEEHENRNNQYYYFL